MRLALLAPHASPVMFDGDRVRLPTSGIRTEDLGHSSTDDYSPSESEELVPLENLAPSSILELEFVEDDESPETLNNLKDLLPSDYQQRIASQPQPLPGFQLIDKLGQGGMGEVWLALRERDQSPVAIKTILPQVATGPNDLAKQFLKILHESPVPIHKRRADIPEQLNFILQRALAKEPQDRFGSVGEMRQSLLELS